ncbi:hypothetical protein HELRODRAFT_166327 [Helobdella robusta]|uniref:Uncharacterized protein n=1 Tax=Helobdella robusta TaxID=6412 RepID=T1EY09_HELRO|nr:hypothetical protein HELRODRAFT_166327 [Helobdella robusta]ESN90629.1 hypothetical protein HELRODRAFT_166327 [Helobdella robusta]
MNNNNTNINLLFLKNNFYDINNDSGNFSGYINDDDGDNNNIINNSNNITNNNNNGINFSNDSLQESDFLMSELTKKNFRRHLSTWAKQIPIIVGDFHRNNICREKIVTKAL